jgi:hypothetical protein
MAFTNLEETDMVLIYGEARDIQSQHGKSTVKGFLEEYFPNRRTGHAASLEFNTVECRAINSVDFFGVRPDAVASNESGMVTKK